MSYLLRSWVCLFLLLSSLSTTYAQTSQTLEEVINTYIYSYSLSPSNQFRLAAYAEMKAKISPDNRSIIIRFGDLGTLTLYPGNCLLRTPGYQVFHLSIADTSSVASQAFNARLNHIFESILLMSNGQADPDKIAFVDQHLAKKNIEPFEKIYLRHVLIRYGRYNAEKQKIELHSDWLPERSYQYRKPGDLHIVRRQATPLSLRLDNHILRGYYIRAGGTVFVENQEHVEYFATGEKYDYNVAAFKLFLQKLFIQSVQYIMKTESNRTYQQALLTQNEEETIHNAVDVPFPIATNSSSPLPVKTSQSSIKVSAPVQSLYTPQDWMPMMLSILRSNNVNIGDPDVIQYFVGEPYFPQLYKLLLPAEKDKVDAFLGESMQEGIPPAQFR